MKVKVTRRVLVPRIDIFLSLLFSCVCLSVCDEERRGERE